MIDQRIHNGYFSLRRTMTNRKFDLVIIEARKNRKREGTCIKMKPKRWLASTGSGLPSSVNHSNNLRLAAPLRTAIVDIALL